MIIELDFEKKELILLKDISVADLVDLCLKHDIDVECWKIVSKKEPISWQPYTYEPHRSFPPDTDPYDPFKVFCDTGNKIKINDPTLDAKIEEVP